MNPAEARSRNGWSPSGSIRTEDGASGDARERDLRHRVARFQTPVARIACFQALTTIGGFVGVCAAMYALAGLSPWIALALAPLGAGLLVRTFIVQHDCGHGSFFRSRRANDGLGLLCSLLTMAPYLSWRRQHAGHHGAWNDLDRRDTGVDIYSSCLTVDEYRALGSWRRRWHRLSRAPLVANVILPPLIFLVLYRLPFDMPAAWRRERIGVHLTNLALVALIGGIGIIAGFDRVATVQLPVMVLASIVGVWLFSVQHRSERVVWARHGAWSALSASLEGSTYLRLSSVPRWFTGDIGSHHVHHLNPRIPNYRLRECHDAIAELRAVPPLTLGSAFRALPYILWDERGGRIATCRDVDRARRQGAPDGGGPTSRAIRSSDPPRG